MNFFFLREKPVILELFTVLKSANRVGSDSLLAVCYGFLAEVEQVRHHWHHCLINNNASALLFCSAMHRWIGLTTSCVSFHSTDFAFLSFRLEKMLSKGCFSNV